jgi:hypothetical protein
MAERLRTAGRNIKERWQKDYGQMAERLWTEGRMIKDRWQKD